MPKVCDVCGKGAVVGNRIIRHGLAKNKGGIGLHTTGVTRRRFEPNLHRVKANVNGTIRRLTVCASCIRSGKVLKG